MHPRTLGALYLVAGFLMLNISSIVVISDAAESSASSSIDAVDGHGELPAWMCDRGTDTRRYCVWSGPFGSTYRVTVEGYLPRSLEVYPLISAKLRPDEDMQRSPTVIIRPTVKALDTLSRCDADLCGTFTLCELDAKECETFIREAGEPRSFLVGWAQAVPRGLVQDWQLELTTEEDDASTLAATILKWKNWARFPPGARSGPHEVPPLRPGMQLRAEVRSQANKSVACKIFG